MKSVVFLAILFVPYTTFAQAFPFDKEIKFVHFLIDKGQYADAEWVLTRIDSSSLSRPQKDSLYFERGWLAYTQKKLDSSIYSLSKVSANDPRFLKSQFFSAYLHAYLKQYPQSREMFENIHESDTTIAELKQLELGGLALLQKDYPDYLSHSNHFTYRRFFMTEEENKLDGYAKGIKNSKTKSPVVAGILSAMLPGAGKWYAGKRKQAIGTLLPIISSGLLALEAYRKGGINNTRFWIFGSIFATFYIGNIWGSAMSVKIKTQELDKSYENKILLDMHILFAISSTKAQNLTVLAEEKKSNGFYREASVLYERVLFTESDSIAIYNAIIGKIDCYKRENLFADAVVFIKNNQFIVTNSEFRNHIYSQWILCAYLSNQLSQSLSLIEQAYILFPAHSDSSLLQFFKILCLNEQNNWKEARQAYVEWLSLLHKDTMLANVYNRLPKLKNPETASWLSTFIPGAGQLYVHKPFEALASILIQAAGIYYGIYSFQEKYYLSAWLVGGGIFGSFHMGGVRRSENLAIQFNKRKSANFNGQLKQMLSAQMNEYLITQSKKHGM